MYCRNCGEEITNNQAVICVKCGTKIGRGKNFCYYCGSKLMPGSDVCLKCGCSTKETVAGANAKSKLAAGLLGIFLGGFGIHNFYLGYTSKAVVQLVCTIIGILTSCLVIGGFLASAIWIWGLVEGIFILCGRIDVDAQGNPLGD